MKTTKTGKPRIVPLPVTVAEALLEHRGRQEEYRRSFGPDYHATLDLVFAEPDGSFLKPDSVSAKVSLLARKLGMKRVSLHTLRHSHGSQLLANGVPLPVVSKRLGHSSVAVTAAIYSHSFTKDEIEAAEIWDRSVGATVVGVRDQIKQ